MDGPPVKLGPKSSGRPSHSLRWTQRKFWESSGVQGRLRSSWHALRIHRCSAILPCEAGWFSASAAIMAL